MSYITLKCKSCGADMSLNPDSKAITCKHCSSTYMLVDLLDDTDKLFTKQLSKKDVENMIEFSDAIKKGETYIYQAEYKLAEESFKKAIEYNNKSHKGYFGVVKAKTENFNKIPDENDYLEYAKLALAHVDKDDEAHVKSEIAKLTFLANEKKLKIKQLKQKEVEQEIHEKNKRANEKFFSQITAMLIFLFTALVLLAIYMTKVTSVKDPPTTVGATYEIATYADLEKYSQKKNFLSSTIILKNDIDFDLKTWSPIGTKDKPFTGRIQGNGFKISNLNITNNNDEGFNCVGFIGYAKNATITGLIFENTSINDEQIVNHQTTTYFGIVCGFLDNSTLAKCGVENTCTIKVSHQNKSSFSIGGLAGSVENSKISYSYSNATINSKMTNGTSFITSITLNYHVGGICGDAKNSSVVNTYSSSTITNDISVSDSFSADVCTAGLIGNFNLHPSSANVTFNFFSGKVTSSFNGENNHFVSGVIGYGENKRYMSNNFAIYSVTSYNINSTYAEKIALHDALNEEIVQYLTETNLSIKINSIFSNTYWDKTNPLSPTLKIA